MLKGTVFKCHDDMAQLVMQSELGASRAILDAGYNLDCLLIRYQVGDDAIAQAALHRSSCAAVPPQDKVAPPQRNPTQCHGGPRTLQSHPIGCTAAHMLLASKTSECLIVACHLQSG